jgi:hypothetical protein
MSGTWEPLIDNREPHHPAELHFLGGSPGLLRKIIKKEGRGEEEERKRRGRGEEEERKRRGREGFIYPCSTILPFSPCTCLICV